MSLLAHGIGGVRDLPVPDWLFLWGGAVVLVLSFLALGTLWRRPLLERLSPGRPLPPGLERVLRSTVLRVVLGSVSAALLVLVFLTALLGEPSSALNLAPTFVYVVFWLGTVVLQVVLGNVWPALNPWLAIADAVAWLGARLGRVWEPLAAYPERLGVYPAAVLLFAFTALELAYSDPASPRSLAIAIALYSYVTWFGMTVFGRRAWLTHGEAFTVYFGLLARVAPFGQHDGRLVFRAPLSGLAGADRRPGVLAFVAAMLGSVGFDGLSRATFWQDLRARVEGPYVLESPGLADLVGTLLALAGLLGCILLVCAAYLAAVQVARAGDQGAGTKPAVGLLAEPRPDRPGVRGRALLHAAPDPGSVRDPARLRPIRLRLGRSRNLRLPAEPRAALAELGLVRPGRGPRRRPHGGTRSRARPSDQRPLAARCAPLAIRDVGADGAVYGWRTVAALAGLNAMVAHGGLGGAVVESLVVLGIVGVFVTLWLRERRARTSEAAGDGLDQIKPQ